MCFIADNGINTVWFCIHVRAGTFEHIIDTALPVSGQFFRINISWCTVFGCILCKHSIIGQLCKQIHCNHCFSCSRASFYNNRPFFLICHTHHNILQDLFIDNLLLVQHDKFLISLYHTLDSILKALRWSDFSMINIIQELFVIACFY